VPIIKIDDDIEAEVGDDFLNASPEEQQRAMAEIVNASDERRASAANLMRVGSSVRSSTNASPARDVSNTPSCRLVSR